MSVPKRERLEQKGQEHSPSRVARVEESELDGEMHVPDLLKPKERPTGSRNERVVRTNALCRSLDLGGGRGDLAKLADRIKTDHDDIPGLP